MQLVDLFTLQRALHATCQSISSALRYTTSHVVTMREGKYTSHRAVPNVQDAHGYTRLSLAVAQHLGGMRGAHACTIGALLAVA